MFRAKLIILIAATMVFAQFQCALACAGNLCTPEFAKSQPVPPCHRHHDHSHDRGPASCGYQLTSPPATSVQMLQMRAPIMPVLGAVANSLSVVATDGRANQFVESAAFSPLESPHLISSVLRI